MLVLKNTEFEDFDIKECHDISFNDTSSSTIKQIINENLDDFDDFENLQDVSIECSTFYNHYFTHHLGISDSKNKQIPDFTYIVYSEDDSNLVFSLI